MAEQMYWESVGSKGSDTGPYWGRVYKYDSTGNKEIDVHCTKQSYRTREEAEDAICEWMEDNNIDAELA